MWEPSGLYSKFMLKMPTFLFGKNALNGLKNLAESKFAAAQEEFAGADQSVQVPRRVLRKLLRSPVRHYLHNDALVAP
jgi:hypothetical protein